MINNFKDDELVIVQGKRYPVVGARLRLAHEENKALSIKTNILFYDNENTIIQATITTEKGTFNGIGNASVKRDRILHNAIVELAETRAIARALRFSGYGVEYTGYEEVSDNKEQNIKTKAPHKVFNSSDDIQLASKSQINIIFSIAKSINLSTENLRTLIEEKTNKKFTKDLTEEDATLVIKHLKDMANNDKKQLHNNK